MTASVGSQPVPAPVSAGVRAEVDALKARFLARFGDQPGSPRPNRRTHVVRAPGRVNLIGEHTDYNDGFVFPMAIEPEVRLVCRGRDDGLVRLASAAFEGDPVEFSVQRKIEPGEPEWADYSRGVAAELVAAGVPLNGMDALIDNTLPVGSGLSSSAAVEVATAHAFLTLSGQDMDPQRVALLCQKAEHEFPKVPCGIMDQTIVAGGRAGHAMLLDCRDLSKQHVSIDPRELRVVIVNSMVKHALTGGEYRERREQCEAGVAHFKKLKPDVRALRDVTRDDLAAAEGKLDDLTFRRCRHVVTEIARTVQAAEQLGRRDYDAVGQLMYESHASLRLDYEVSTEELDLLVEEASKVRGVYGARMTGAGFGGCIVALVQPRAVEPLTEHLKKNYTARVGKEPQVYVTSATAGASVIE
ncbi:MAG TPA: galactokinase [Humisphaera sp.]